MRHTQPKDLRSEEAGRDEKELEINNKCLECSKEFDNLEELRIHEKNCYICEQCNNWYRFKEDLDNHKNEAHSKQCEKNLECRKEREQQNIEKHRHEHICDLCNKEFNNESKLKKHLEIDHKIHVYECTYPECEEITIFKEIWRDHMKEEHELGFYR